MKLSLYLLAKGQRLDSSSLRRSKALPLEELDASPNLPFPHVAFVVRNKSSRVTWADYVRPFFDLGDIENVSNSFVLLFEAATRVWAVTYGQGFHVIDSARVESGFGLRVVANCIDPDAVKSADVRTSDVLSRLTRAQVSAGAGIQELGVAVDNEMVRHLAGRLLPGDPDGDWARTMSGADSLQLDISWSLDALSEQCERILDRYESDQYKTNFGFIDNLRPLKAGDARIALLDSRLSEAVSGRTTSKVSVAAPDMIDYNQLDHYEIWTGRTRASIDLSIADIYKFLDSLEPDVDDERLLEKVHLIGVDDSGGALGPQRALYRYLAVELTISDGSFALISGQWYEIDNAYIASIDRIIRGLPNLTDQISLPALQRRSKEGKPSLESERSYNARVAGDSEWSLLDRRNVPHGGPHQRIEVADLAGSQPARFVHVKKMNDSATLSHLWGQGSVSAELYKLDDEYRDKVKAMCAGLPDDMAAIQVIYAVVTDRSGSIAEELFFFSKVHLTQHLRSLRMIGCDVALAKIDVIDVP